MGNQAETCFININCLSARCIFTSISLGTWQVWLLNKLRDFFGFFTDRDAKGLHKL